jgi:hypothetical protein
MPTIGEMGLPESSYLQGTGVPRWYSTDKLTSPSGCVRKQVFANITNHLPARMK